MADEKKAEKTFPVRVVVADRPGIASGGLFAIGRKFGSGSTEDLDVTQEQYEALQARSKMGLAVVKLSGSKVNTSSIDPALKEGAKEGDPASQTALDALKEKPSGTTEPAEPPTPVVMSTEETHRQQVLAHKGTGNKK